MWRRDYLLKRMLVKSQTLVEKYMTQYKSDNLGQEIENRTLGGGEII